MKHEKFVKFIEDISVDGNEYLGESILEAYGICFFGVSLRNEADKLLEAINGNRALCEGKGVLATMRTWPKQKIMGLVLGALITMTAASGQAANAPENIDGARASIMAQFDGGDGDGDDEAVDKMVKGAVKKYGKQIEEKAAEKGHTPTDGDHKTTHTDYKVTEADKIETAEWINDKIKDGTYSLEEIRDLAEYLLNRDNEDSQRSGAKLTETLNDSDKRVENSSDDGSNSMYGELNQNGKLSDAGMSDEDISKYRFGKKYGFGNNSATYSYGDAMVTSDNAPDEAEMKKITQQVKKILSKS